MPSVFNIPSLVPDGSVTTQKIVDGNVTPVKLSSTTLNSYGGSFSNSYTFSWSDAGNHLLNDTRNVFSTTFNGVAGRPVIFNMTKKSGESAQSSYCQLTTVGGKIFGGFGFPGPQFRVRMSLKFNGVELIQLGGTVYANGNYDPPSFTGQTWSFSPFPMLLVPSSTGTQTLTIEIYTYGMIYGSGSITFGGYFSNIDFQLITF